MFQPDNNNTVAHGNSTTWKIAVNHVLICDFCNGKEELGAVTIHAVEQPPPPRAATSSINSRDVRVGLISDSEQPRGGKVTAAACSSERTSGMGGGGQEESHERRRMGVVQAPQESVGNFPP